MKNIIKYLILTLGVASVSCTNLDEELYDVLSQDNFGSTESEMASLIGPAYGTLASYVDGYFWYGMCAGDDFIIPARGTDWYSGGIYLRAHTHDFNATDANTVYNFWKFSEVNTINKIIQMIETSTVEIADKDRTIAELKGIRAWWYFFMLDKLGSVPIVITFDDTIPTNKGVTRTDVFNFVDTELTSIVDDLSEDVSAATYGKFTKWVAYTLLAKLWINAEVYTGKADWEKALGYCDKVIESGKYELEENNNDNFLVENEGSSENIFVIPFDSDYMVNYFIPYQMSWHYSEINAFDINFDCWNGSCATPSQMYLYDDDDKRLGWFLYGQRYAKDGTPLTDRKGNLLNYTFEMADFTNATEVEGARLYKWEVEDGGRNHLNNDFAIFRYVDVLLMKAECLLRTGNEPDARQIVNDCRKRNFDNYDETKEIKLLTLDELLDERAREFIFEGWRRNDMIRFGTYGDPCDFKPNSDPADKHTWVFPIPQQVIDNNSEIVQNPGY